MPLPMPPDRPRSDLDARAARLARRYETLSAAEMLEQALADPSLAPVALVSSFGAESVVLLHMLAQIDAATPVLFLDTEMLFPETLAYQRELSQVLGLGDLRVIRPDRAALLLRDSDGLLHRADPDACCALRKREPLERALAGFGAWITGRKRYQNGTRSTLPLVDHDGTRPKLNPLARWDRAALQRYIADHGLPRHPLVNRGYPSIGCLPCTTRALPGEDARAGRWRGREKTECGIHFPPAAGGRAA